MRRFVEWLKSLFKKKLPEPKKVVGIVIGHDNRRQGAYNYLRESEWSFNRRIAESLCEEVRAMGMYCHVVTRPAGRTYHQQVGTVDQLMRLANPDVVLCLHFNSFKFKALGSEALTTGDANSNLLAEGISDQLFMKLGIIGRGEKEDGVKVIAEGHSGFKMLDAVKKKGRAVCLVEPCFGNFKTKDSIAVFENEDKYVQALRSAIKIYFREG